jgi:two-component system, OmpR family, alkaline phosphatase synthesis response regulator PhoP
MLTKKILLVDDDAKCIAPLAIRLKATGYEVLTAHNGMDGLKLAVQHKPDLIVMDIWMPHGMGILTAQRIKHFGLENVPLIFITASRKEELWAIAEEVRPAGFFEKPYDSKEVILTIGKILSRNSVSPEIIAPHTQTEKQIHYEKNIDCRR